MVLPTVSNDTCVCVCVCVCICVCDGENDMSQLPDTYDESLSPAWSRVEMFQRRF